MKKNVILPVIVFGLMVIGNLEAQTDSRLNGRWVTVNQKTEREYRLNDGNFVLANDGVIGSRGTYTTNNGEIIFNLTHFFGGDLGLESKWYSINEFIIAIRPLFVREGASEEMINEIFYYMISIPKATYSVEANSLILVSTVEGEKVVEIFTKR